MAKKDVKLELQALKLAEKIDDPVFTHVFGGYGLLHFNSEDLAHPFLKLNLARGAGELIFNTIKSHPLEYYGKSYSAKYGKGTIPFPLLYNAYYQVQLTDDKMLEVGLDWSETRLEKQYKGQPEVRVVNDFIFKDEKQLSPLLPAFMHLYNTRLKDEKWCVLAVTMKYALDNERISFEKFTEIFKKLNQ